MVRKHIKRLSSPKSWPIGRKERTWVTRPRPGRSFTLAIALNNALKELTGVARTSKEVRYLVRNIGIEVNGKRCNDFRRPVGFLDVISIPSEDAHFRIGLSKKGKLKAVSIDKKDAAKRVVKITGKTRVAGKFQLNCADSSNFLVDKTDYNVGDSLIVEGSTIKKHLPLKAGMTIILTSGSHLSALGEVVSLDGNVITFKNDDGEQTTAKKCAFVVGEKEAEVTLR